MIVIVVELGGIISVGMSSIMATVFAWAEEAVVVECRLETLTVAVGEVDGNGRVSSTSGTLADLLAVLDLVLDAGDSFRCRCSVF